MKVGLTGGEGLLARYILRESSPDIEWVVTSRRPIEGVHSSLFDLARESDLQAFLSSLNVDALIHTAAEGNVDDV